MLYEAVQSIKGRGNVAESGIAEAIRNEDGNERYEYFFPMNDPEKECCTE